MKPREYPDIQHIDVLDDTSIGHLLSLIEILSCIKSTKSKAPVGQMKQQNATLP